MFSVGIPIVCFPITDEKQMLNYCIFSIAFHFIDLFPVTLSQSLANIQSLRQGIPRILHKKKIQRIVQKCLR